MLSNRLNRNMDRITIHKNKENERLLLEELERISSDKHRPSILSHSVFGAESFSFDSSPMLSSLSLDAAPHDEDLHLNFDQPHSPMSYPPLDSDEHSSVHVDHSGKLSYFPASAWLASTLSSLPPSATVSSTSSTHDRTPAPLNACVAAAAATAAMIVVPDSINSKRPRSPSPISLEVEQVPQKLTDHTMHSESELTDDPTSPRSIQNFAGSMCSPSFKSACHTDEPHPVRVRSASSKSTAHCPSNLVNTCSSDSRKASVVISTESTTDAEMSRKRRAEAMDRFRRKKAVRCYARRVRYQVRKRIATTRPRVNGRFARRIDAINHAAKHAK